MNGSDQRTDPANPSLAEAVAVARDLIARLATDLAVRPDAGDMPTLLRQTQDVLNRFTPAAATSADAVTANGTAPIMLVDVSDLLGYFEHNRLPTGIQRVQAEFIFNTLKSHGATTGLCCFVEARSQWAAVDSAQFRDICIQSRVSGDPLEPQWMELIRAMKAKIDSSPAMIFPQGAVLVNIGTSWWLPNYFLYVRQAKITAGVRYVPLIYDLIPALMPDNCNSELVQEFLGWIIGVLEHADFYMVISEATRNDLIDFAEKIGRPISANRIAVMPLDADFRAAELRPPQTARRFAEPFVLFVSTLEARKNQLGALDAWAALIARHGPEKVPRLVMVGKRGFKSDLILNRIESNADLRERVSILSGIEDVELQALYRDCLFTIYPSLYEGWGLPVTESLCYGKVPLVADNSSLPEAGGASALYFPTGSTVAMVAALERLILDDGFRQEREKAIRSEFRPRGWASIAADAADHILQWAATPLAEWRALPVCPDTYYPLRRNQSMRAWRGMGSAESFRYGLGWFRMEDHGCWTQQAGGELELRLRNAVRRLGFEIFCVPRHDVRYRIQLVGHETVFVEGRMEDGESKWAFLDLPDMPDDAVVQIRLTTTILHQPELGWNGDFRRLGIGLRGLFAFGGDITSRLQFIEAAALGALQDLSSYRDRSLEIRAG